MKRGIKKTECQLIPVWMPSTLVPTMDEAVAKEDSDRSKFIRNAVREKIRRAGIKVTARELIGEKKDGQ